MVPALPRQVLERTARAVRQRSLRLLGAPRRVKRVIAGLADATSCILAAWFAFMLRLGEVVPISRPVALFMAFELVCVAAAFYACRLYDQVFRFSGPRAMGQIMRGCATAFVPTVIVFGFISTPGVPRTLSVIFPILLFIFVALSRIVVRYFFVEMLEVGKERLRVVIFGSGTAARKLGRSLEHEPGYNLLGYLDSGEGLAGTRIEGIPVFADAELEAVLKRAEIDVVLLAVPRLPRTERRQIVERLQRESVEVRVLPGLDEIVSGEVAISDLRPVELEDLLARPAVAPRPDLMSAAIEGRVILITGAGGSIGSELCRQVFQQGPRQLVLFEMTEAALFSIERELVQLKAATGRDCEIIAELGTLVDPSTVERLFERYRPDTVYHAAAYKHVPLVEHNVVAGVRNNVLGTLNCITAARIHGASRFVLVSTDKAVRPTNVMGASKRVCELILQAVAAEQDNELAVGMVRFGNVLGSSGSVVPQFQAQIASGGPVTITHREVTRYFMTIPEAAELVIQAGTMAQGGEVYLLDMGEPVRILDLAKSMIQLSGRTVRDSANPDGEIAIEEIGLRPGEKLYEELLIDAEAEKTEHPRIFKAREGLIPWPELVPLLTQIRAGVDNGDRETLLILLADMVPGYSRSSNDEGAGKSVAHSPSVFGEAK